jgi:hypothetical protein
VVEAVFLSLANGGKGAEGGGRAAGLNGPVGGALLAGGEELRAGERSRGGIHLKEAEWTADEGDGGGVPGIDGFEAEGHIEVDLDAVAVFPAAAEREKGAGLRRVDGMRTIDGDAGGGSGPGGDAEIQGEGFGAAGVDAKGDLGGMGILRALLECEAGAVLVPVETGGDIEVDVDVGIGAEEGADAVVGGDLGEGAGAAGPLVGVTELGAGVVVVGVVEGVAVGEDGERAEDGVVKNLLHAVAVAGVGGDAQEVAGDFEVSIGAAGGFEAGVGIGEAGAVVAGTGNAEGFVGSPAAGRIALGVADEGESVAGGAEMLFAAEDEVRLGGGAEGVDVTVGVLAGEDVAALGKRVEVVAILEEAFCEGEIAGIAGAVVSEEEIFGEGVALVPGPGNVGVGAGGHFGTGEGLGRKEGEDDVGRVSEDFEGVGIVRELVSVDEAAGGFVGGVSGEGIVAPEIRRDGLGVSADKAGDFGLRRLVAGGGIGAGESRHVLAEGVTGDVAGHIAGRIEIFRPGVPAAHGLAGGGESGFLAKGLEE